MSDNFISCKNAKLLYWKKIIMTAESSGLKKTEWMRKHGISKKTYYYWHSKLAHQGMLDGCCDGLEDFSIPDEIPNRHTLEPLQGKGQELVEYTVPVDMPPGPSDYCPSYSQPVPQIMIQYGAANIYVGDAFSSQTLSKVLEVIRDVK